MGIDWTGLTLALVAVGCFAVIGVAVELCGEWLAGRRGVRR